jgi:hypothetical protein
VTIETPASIVQGAAGFGGEEWGVLRVLAVDPGDVITPEMIDARSAFSIVIGGAGITAEALHKARQEQVKGIVVGSIDARELEAYWGPRFDGNWSRVLRVAANVPGVDDGPTLLLTEGFGFHPMSRPIFELLSRCDRQEAYLDGLSRLDAPAHRPRLVVPHQQPSGGTPPAPSRDPRPGAIVRLLDEAHLGRIGRVESRNSYGRLPSGVRVPVATVQIGEAERVVLPQTALDVME